MYLPLRLLFPSSLRPPPSAGRACSNAACTECTSVQNMETSWWASVKHLWIHSFQWHSPRLLAPPPGRGVRVLPVRDEQVVDQIFFWLYKIFSDLKKMSWLLTTRLTMQLGQSQSWPAAGQDTGPAPLLHSLDIGIDHFWNCIQAAAWSCLVPTPDLLTISELLFCLHCLTTPLLFRPNCEAGPCWSPHLQPAPIIIIIIIISWMVSNIPLQSSLLSPSYHSLWW